MQIPETGHTQAIWPDPMWNELIFLPFEMFFKFATEKYHKTTLLFTSLDKFVFLEA